MNQALEAPDGVRVGFADEDEATFYRMRMNQARQLDRRFNKTRFASDHPMHSRSEYDALMFRIRHSDGMYWVYAERKAQRGVIEEIKHAGPKEQTHSRTARATTVGLPPSYSTKGYRR